MPILEMGTNYILSSSNLYFKLQGIIGLDIILVIYHTGKIKTIITFAKIIKE